MYWYRCEGCGLIEKVEKEENLNCELCGIPLFAWKVDLTDNPELSKYIYKERTRRKLGFITEDYYIVLIDNIYRSLQDLTDDELDTLQEGL